MTKLSVGQRWTYRTRPQDPASTFIIGRIDAASEQPTIVHVAVEQVSSPTSQKLTTIGHLPFSDDAIEASIRDLVELNAPVDAVFAEGYQNWRHANGGVFETTVSETLNLLFKELVPAEPNPSTVDRFDTIVTEMNACSTDQQAQEHRHALSTELFSLDQWYFLCDPADHGAPVEWVFPDGPDQSPTILAFTSEERARSAGVELGLYPAGGAVPVMPSPVEAALEWISGDQFQHEWLSFNLTQQNFPLYVTEVLRHRNT